MSVYPDVEDIVRTWLRTTTVAPLVLRTPGNYSIYLAMPKGSPLPAVVASLIGGGPTPGKSLPEATSRMTFSCWATTRTEAGLIARTLLSELDALATGNYQDPGGTYLSAALVLLMRWQPDPDSDTARYVVDALITTVT